MYPLPSIFSLRIEKAIHYCIPGTLHTLIAGFLIFNSATNAALSLTAITISCLFPLIKRRSKEAALEEIGQYGHIIRVKKQFVYTDRIYRNDNQPEPGGYFSFKFHASSIILPYIAVHPFSVLTAAVHKKVLRGMMTH